MLDHQIQSKPSISIILTGDEKDILSKRKGIYKESHESKYHVQKILKV